MYILYNELSHLYKMQLAVLNVLRLEAQLYEPILGVLTIHVAHTLTECILNIFYKH